MHALAFVSYSSYWPAAVENHGPSDMHRRCGDLGNDSLIHFDSSLPARQAGLTALLKTSKSNKQKSCSKPFLPLTWAYCPFRSLGIIIPAAVCPFRLLPVGGMQGSERNSSVYVSVGNLQLCLVQSYRLRLLFLSFYYFPGTHLSVWAFFQLLPRGQRLVFGLLD